MTTSEINFADKIAKLLAKAEDEAATPAEAEAFTAKAQEWMTRYAIDEAMVAKARGSEAPQKIVEEQLTFVGLWSRAHFTVAGSITDANDVRTLMSRGGYVKDKHGTLRHKSDVFKLHLIGFEGDVRRVKLLNSSLQIQAQAAANAWWKEHSVELSWMSSNQKHIEKREFYIGFAQGVKAQLQKVRERTVKEAEAENTTGESVALVLRDKKERVDDWVDQTYGKLRRVSARYQSGGRRARLQGHAAGLSADAGGTGKVAGAPAGALGR